ncbi:MAG: M3 family oligoendopeptidase, partial [Sphingobacteriales bacterium]
MITELPKPKERTYLPSRFKLSDWNSVASYFDELKNREINSKEELEQWMLDRSELEAALSEDMAWRYIKMTCNTQDEKIAEAFQFFVSEIEPHIAPFDHELNEKLVNSAYFDKLDHGKYHIFLRGVK